MSHNRRVPNLLIRRAGLATAAGLGLAAVLSGCTTSPGAAALVGDQRISNSRITDAVQTAMADPALASVVGTKTDQLARQELDQQIILILLRAQAAKDGVTVSQDQIDAAVAGAVKQAGGQSAIDQQLAQQGEPPADLKIGVEENLLLEAIAGKETGSSSPTQTQTQSVGLKALAEQTQALGVHVNPRWGTWSPAHAAVLPVDKGLSAPANG